MPAALRPPRPVPAPRTSLQTRIVSQSVILTGFVVVVLTTLSFWVARSLLEQSVRGQLAALSAVAEDNLERTLRGYRERASYAALRSDVREALRTDAADRSVERVFAALRSEESSLTALAFLAPAGQVRAQAGAAAWQWDRTDRPRQLPVVTERGWESLDVLVPVRHEDRIIGALALRFTMRDALAPLLAAVPSLGSTARLVFLSPEDESVSLILSSVEPADSFTLTLSGSGDLHSLDTLMIAGGTGRRENERGRDTLVAYRPLPALGWGMLLEVERKDALSGVRRLALTHASIGTLLLLLAGILALVLARQVTDPLRHLTARVRHLGPGRWLMRRSVQTEDEVGVLEHVLVDLSSRLRRLYEHLEEEIAARTAALRRQYTLDRAILTHIAYGIVTVDRDGKITGMNPAALAMVGGEERSLRKRAATSVFPLCTPDGRAIGGKHPVLQSLEEGKTVRSAPGGRDMLRRSDGSLLPVAYVASPLLQGQRVFGALFVCQDVSEERLLEERKSEFVTLASHQLRTPLSSLHWYVELLGEDTDTLTAEQREYLAEMQRATDRMLALLTTLLHAAQYEGKGVQPSFRDTDVSALVREAYAEAQDQARAAQVTCALALPPQPVRLRTDPVHLKVILQNLLSNAVKYAALGSERRVTVTLEALRGGARLSVADTGIGIPAQDRKRIFQRFFRASNVRKLDTDGNGLGLSICKSIVERLGGTIRFTSKENEGTTFLVTLPKKPKNGAGKRVKDEGLGTKDGGRRTQGEG